jgi:hypothetical protein
MMCRAVYKSNCYHRNGHDAECVVYTTMYMVVFGAIQILFSQLPSFQDLTWLSILSAVMSFTYSFIGVGLSLARTITGEIRSGKNVITVPRCVLIHSLICLYDVL